jgi:hypothetical protein
MAESSRRSIWFMLSRFCFNWSTLDAPRIKVLTFWFFKHQRAEDLGLPLVNLALCWCLKNQNVSTLILGASKVDQLKQNLDSINHMERLEDSAMERIETILNNKP